MTTSGKMPYKLIHSTKSSISCLTFLKLKGTFILCAHDLNIESGILQKERNSHFFLVMDWCPLRDQPQSSRNGKAIHAEVDFLQLAKISLNVMRMMNDFCNRNVKCVKLFIWQKKFHAKYINIWKDSSITFKCTWRSGQNTIFLILFRWLGV